MHQVLQLDLVAYEILPHLCPRSACESAAACKAWKEPSLAIVDAAYEVKFASAIPCIAARQQLVRLLGSPVKSARAALEWRRHVAKRGQKLEMLQTGADRLIGAARLEGADVFAACKRAVLSSYEPMVSEIPEVERWMGYIVEAVDNGRFEDSISAWRWFAEHGLLEDGSARWLLELAHSLGDLEACAPLLNEYPALRQQVEAYAVLLRAHPSLGHYTAEKRLRDIDVTRLLNSIAVQTTTQTTAQTTAQTAAHVDVRELLGRLLRVT